MNPTLIPTPEQLAAREQHERDCADVAESNNRNIVGHNPAHEAKLARERGEETGFDQSREASA